MAHVYYYESIGRYGQQIPDKINLQMLNVFDPNLYKTLETYSNRCKYGLYKSIISNNVEQPLIRHIDLTSEFYDPEILTIVNNYLQNHRNDMEQYLRETIIDIERLDHFDPDLYKILDNYSILCHRDYKTAFVPVDYSEWDDLQYIVLTAPYYDRDGLILVDEYLDKYRNEYDQYEQNLKSKRYHSDEDLSTLKKKQRAGYYKRVSKKQRTSKQKKRVSRKH